MTDRKPYSCLGSRCYIINRYKTLNVSNVAGLQEKRQINWFDPKTGIAHQGHYHLTFSDAVTVADVTMYLGERSINGLSWAAMMNGI